MKLNWIDKAVSFFDPKAGLKRAQSRSAIQIIERGYEGARKDRRTRGWRLNESEEFAKPSERKTLKSRSRDLYRNNPFSHRAHNSIANNTTGTGIVPAIKNENLKKIWKEWASSVNVDFDQNLDFYGIQNLCMRTLSIHGEVLVLRVKSTDKKRVPLELKVISTAFLDTTKDTEATPEGGYIASGIEYYKSGKRKGYWIYPKNPQVFYEQSVFWKNEDVIHLFFIDEPGQAHGVPFGSSSMMNLRDYDDYADAQLMRQKIAACFSVFITKTDADVGGFSTNKDDEDRLDRVEPGIIEHLEPGKSVTFASPPPAEGYGEYSRNVLTSVSSGFGMSYEAMTGDLSNVNYSSGRMGWLEYQRMIETWQSFILIPKLCAKVWDWFLEAGEISGKIQNIKQLSVEWTVPGRKMIDPVKEIRGLVEQVRAGLMSWQEAVRSLGYRPEEVLEELKESAVLFDQAGIKPKSDPRFDTMNLESQNDE